MNSVMMDSTALSARSLAAGATASPAATPAADSGNGSAAAPSEPTIAALDRTAALRLLSQQVFASVSRVLSFSFNSLADAYLADPSPEQLTGDVVNAVNTALADPASQADAATLVDDVKTQVATGIDDTEHLLGEQAEVPDGVETDLARARGLVDGALDELLAAPSGESTRTVESTVTELRTSRTGAVRITTQDGDVVELDFGNALTSTSAAVQIREAGLAVNSTTYSLERQAGLSFRVTGELDRNELRAVRKLVQRVDNLARKFFRGNIAGALKKIAGMKIDAREIASAAFSIATTTSVQQSRTTAQVLPSAASPAASNSAPENGPVANELSAPPAEPALVAPAVVDEAAAELPVTDAVAAQPVLEDSGRDAFAGLGKIIGEFVKLLDELAGQKRYARPGRLIADIASASLQQRHERARPGIGLDTGQLEIARSLLRDLLDPAGAGADDAGEAADA